MEASTETLEWSLHYLQEREQYERDYIERILGVTWDRLTVNAMSGKGKGKGGTGDKVHIPLVLGMKPELLKDLQAMFGGKSQVNEEVPDDARSLASISKEAFVSLIGKHLGKEG